LSWGEGLKLVNCIKKHETALDENTRKRDSGPIGKEKVKRMDKEEKKT